MARSGDTLRSRLATLLDRPDVLLLVVPLGALYVGMVQARHSAGLIGINGLVGFLGVALFYLAQTVALIADQRWARSSYARWIIASSPFACLLYDFFLVDPLPPVYWAWLIAPVLMIAVYICTLPDVFLVGVFAYAAGLLFFAESGLDTRSHVWLLVVLAAMWALPAVLTRRVLGDLAQRTLELQERRGRDPISGALNRQGLEDGFTTLLAQLARQDPDATVGVLVVDLVRVKEVAEVMGNTVVTGVLERTGDLLRRAYRRDNLVGRPRGDSFVVVTPHDAASVGAVVVDELRRAHANLRISARVGAVADVPVSQVTGEWLGALVRVAEGRCRAAADGAVDAVRFADAAVVPGPAHVPTVAAPIDEPETAAGVAEASSRLFGAGLVAVALLVASIPVPATGTDVEHLVLLTASAVLAAVGVLTAAEWIGGRWLHVAASVLALAVVALTVPVADGQYAAYVALTLVPFPVYLAALTLPMGTATGLAALLPPAAFFALMRGGFERSTALTAFFAVIGFGLVTCAMALWVRRQRDRLTQSLYRMALVDPGTGLLSREGLVERYRRFAAGTDLAVVYVDIDDMARLNAEYGYHGGDAILRRVATVLAEVVRPDGAAARVGGDEFVLLVPGVGRSAPVVGRLTERLAMEDVPVHVSLGQAFGRTDGETTLWRLMGHADEALLLNRARERRSTVGRAVDLRARRPARTPVPDLAAVEPERL